MSSKRIKDLTVNGIDYRLASSGEGGSVDIIDNLTSTDSDAALSANQGKVLNEKIENIETQTVVADYDSEGEILKLQFNTPVQGIVEDTLESNNSFNALSAKQGKILNEKLEANTQLIDTLKAQLVQVGLATGDDSRTVPANYEIHDLGRMTIPANCVATVRLSANVRTVNSVLQFAMGCENGLGKTNYGWNPTHQNIAQYHTTSDTWMYVNNTNQECVLTFHAKSSIATSLMYISVQAVCIPLIN